MQNIFNFKQIFKFPVLLIATTLVTTNLTAMNGGPEPISNHIAGALSAVVKVAGSLTGGTIAFAGAAVEYAGKGTRFFGDGVVKVSGTTSDTMEKHPKITIGITLLGAAAVAFYLYSRRV